MAAQLAAKPAVLAGEQLLLQRLFHDQAKLLDLERLGDVVVGTVPDGRDGGVGARERRHDDDDGLRRALPHGVQQLDPAAPRHANVGNRHIEFVGFEMKMRTREVPGGGDVVTLAAEEDLQELSHASLVVDHEHPRLPSHSGASARGSCTRIIVPAPSTLST